MSCCDTKHPATNPGAGGFGACVPGALPGGLSRTRFFDGMILTQADLENEQRFWRVKRRLTNRALGAGVVWGLRLRWDAARRIFTLGPGYALDCCGNDLIVECATEIGEAQLLAIADPEIRATDPIVSRAQAPLTHACLVLQYVECPEHARPVHLDPCAPASNRCEPSRVRETTRLLLVPPPSAPPPDCLDDFHAELEALKASIDEPLRGQLFPPEPAGPAPAPGPDGMLPATLRVTVVGDGQRFAAEPLVLPANGGVDASALGGSVQRTSARRVAVEFVLQPTSGWGFYQGYAAHGMILDRVAPPIDFQLFWSLELEVPLGQSSATMSVACRVRELGLEQMFGDRARGLAEIEIAGTLTVHAVDNTLIFNIPDLNVTVTSAVAEARGDASCLEDLVPWGFMADPRTAEVDAKSLLLAAIYAYFADVTARSGGAWTPARLRAAEAYRFAWELLGADLSIPNAEAQKEQLARLVARLFDCWCEAMLYPGPRCTDEHHGVFLGCATIARGGQILAFDMWEHRRHVLLGPLVEHWLGVFGIAPLDVIAGRFAQAICCVAGLPLPGLPPQQGNAITMGRGTLSVGPGARRGGPATPFVARDIGIPELVGRMVASFVADVGAPLVAYRARTPAGTPIELVAPAPIDANPSAVAIDTAVDGLLRGADALPPLARSSARAAIGELAREVDAASLPELRGAAAELAKRLSAGGVTLAKLIETGPGGLLASMPDADPVAVDELSARAEAALAGLAEGVSTAARKPAPARPSATLRDAELRKSIAADLKKRLGLTRARVDAALDRAAARVP
jgi:hypothetical protein